MTRALTFTFLFLASTVAINGEIPGVGVWEPPAGPQQMLIWPGTPPDARPVTGPETFATNTTDLVAGKPWVHVDNVSQPTITRFAPQGVNTGAAVVVFRGGGYWLLAIDLEGTEVCDWLASRGITAISLKYRVPGEGKLPKSGAYPQSADALQDAQRAISLVRAHAAEWHVDPHKIGVVGFSAGGHLVAAVSTLFHRRLYPVVDDADKESSRPDFALALYPGHMLENTTKDFELNPAIPVTSQTSPTFIVQAEDDDVDDVRNSLVYYAALKKAGVPAEMHLYPHGGHGFGLRRTDAPITHWPELAETWSKAMGCSLQGLTDALPPPASGGCWGRVRQARLPIPSPPFFMNQPTPRQIERLRTAYAAFNARDIDAALATMTADVAWPRAFKGGFVEGPRAVRAYWTEQWSEISPQVEPVAFHLEEDGRILVGVHQMVRDLAGAVLADEHVGHRFTLSQGLIRKMEVCSSPSSAQPA